MGDAYHVSGAAWRHGYGKRYHLHSLVPLEVFGVCAAAALYPRDLFLKVGGFDEDFFHEDVDLAFRLRLLGHRCLYVPEAVVEHISSGSFGPRSDFMLYYGHRNLILTHVKNMPNPFFWLYLPSHLLLNIFSLFWFSIKGKVRTIFRAKWDALLGFQNILKKRKMIRYKRMVEIKEIINVMDHYWLNPYLGPRWRREKTALKVD